MRLQIEVHLPCLQQEINFIAIKKKHTHKDDS